jgi:hypothetical protein
MGHPNVKQLPSSELTPQQHIKIAEEHLAEAEELSDIASAQLEADIAMVHYIAAGVKLCHNLLGGKRSAGGAAVMGLVSKIAR